MLPCPIRQRKAATMTRILLSTIFTSAAASAAFADPGHLANAGHGHDHWLGYGTPAVIAAVAAGIWLARYVAATSTRSA